jgi:hypothetical protein
MEYMTGMSEWLGLIAIKGIFDSEKQPSAGNFSPIPAYRDKLR